jgi:hypothetical protein
MKNRNWCKIDCHYAIIWSNFWPWMIWFQAYPLMSAEKPFRCISPISMTDINNNNKSTWADTWMTRDQCNVNITDLSSKQHILVPCTEWEFEQDGRLTLQVSFLNCSKQLIHEFSQPATPSHPLSIFLYLPTSFTFLIRSVLWNFQ